MTKPRWIGLVAVVCVLLVAAGTALWLTRPLQVATAKARIGPVTDLVYATGFVEAQQTVAVQARITAPVSKILVDEGDRVVRGQPLFLLADEEQRALSAQAAAQRRAAEQAESRALTLFRQGWVTRAARDQAVANADAARAAQGASAARQNQLVVRAEIDGVMTKRDIEPGELASPGRVLAQLGDPARVRITATVDERDITRVRVGQPAQMSSDAWPGRIITARVAEITPSGDPNQRAFRVRLQPAAGSDLPLGISLEINITTHRDTRAVLVPAGAVREGQLWVIADGRARQRAVKVGTSGTAEVQILSGLAAGERVIAMPPADLADGQRVTEKR